MHYTCLYGRGNQYAIKLMEEMVMSGFNMNVKRSTWTSWMPETPLSAAVAKEYVRVRVRVSE